MIINSQLISDMLLKQETGEENKKFAIPIHRMAIRFEEGFGGWSGLNSDVGVSDICAELKNEKTYL